MPWYLDKALTLTQNYVSLQGPAPWATVLQQLQQGLVLGARVGWNGGGGHFMVIYGATQNGATQYLYIDDPIYGKSVLTYNQFLNNYQGSGKWTTTYLTKKHSYFMIFKDLLYNKKLLKPIEDIKPHLASMPEFAHIKSAANEKKEDFALPHYTYVLGLDSLQAGKGLPEKANTLRVMELGGQQPEALYELALDEKNPELVQMNMDKKYFGMMEGSINMLRDHASQKKQAGELRLLKLPALNTEAFWLHYDMPGEEDVFAPVKKFEEDNRFDWKKSYSEKEFMSLLKDHAAQIDLKDDLLGA